MTRATPTAAPIEDEQLSRPHKLTMTLPRSVRLVTPSSPGATENIEAIAADLRVPWREACIASGMSKNNVNPDYYKVAGRERQGENILQERHRQTMAQLRARERFELRAAASPRRDASHAPDSPESAPEPEPAAPAPKAKAKGARTSKSTTKKQRATSRTPANSRSSKKKTSSKKKPTTRAKATSTAKKKKRASSPARAKAGGAQASGKRGKRSTAQKRASSRNDFGSMPATRPVAGAFGKRPSAGRRPKK